MTSFALLTDLKMPVNSFDKFFAAVMTGSASAIFAKMFESVPPFAPISPIASLSAEHFC